MRILYLKKYKNDKLGKLHDIEAENIDEAKNIVSKSRSGEYLFFNEWNEFNAWYKQREEEKLQKIADELSVTAKGYELYKLLKKYEIIINPLNKIIVDNYLLSVDSNERFYVVFYNMITGNYGKYVSSEELSREFSRYLLHRREGEKIFIVDVVEMKEIIPIISVNFKHVEIPL